jgi:hypothetical protein
MFVGIILLILGALMLLERLGIIYGDIWEYLLPIVLIALGASMVFRSQNKRSEQ